MKHKRLFLFAGYDINGVIDESLIYYLRNLSKYGDVVLYMDNDCDKSELQKIDKYTIFAGATHHGEYDFGSYKRAFCWAKENVNLSKYEFLYMVNDSVYGPFWDLQKYLIHMENMNTGAFGMTRCNNKQGDHIESWFVGMRQNVFMSSWFDEFINSVKHESDKGTITYMYEHGLTRLFDAHNISWDALYNAPGRSVYNRVKYFYKKHMPFMKKNAFIRHNGELGRQILYVLNHIPKKLHDAILENAIRVYGENTVTRLLTNNPVRIIWRRITYAIHKILTRGL